MNGVCRNNTEREFGIGICRIQSSLSAKYTAHNLQSIPKKTYKHFPSESKLTCPSHFSYFIFVGQSPQSMISRFVGHNDVAGINRVCLDRASRGGFLVIPSWSGCFADYRFESDVLSVTFQSVLRHKTSESTLRKLFYDCKVDARA